MAECLRGYVNSDEAQKFTKFAIVPLASVVMNPPHHEQDVFSLGTLRVALLTAHLGKCPDECGLVRKALARVFEALRQRRGMRTDIAGELLEFSGDGA